MKMPSPSGASGALLVIGLAALALPADAAPAAGGIERVAWLQGCWESASPERTVEERWMPPRGGSMVGVGRTLRGRDLAEYELVVLREDGDRLAYEAHPSGQPAATFASEAVSEGSVVFQNPGHDFPKRIGYERVSPDQLLAWIDGGADSERPRIEFAYKRVPCEAAATARAESGARSIQQALLAEPNQKTAEVSTEELRKVLVEKSAAVFDARPFMEYATSHIPGARNVAARPGLPMSMYVSDVAEIGRAQKGDKTAPIVLYCNGPFCGKSKRLAEELAAAGFTSVRRYQLGIPVWRALGGVTEIEAAGLGHVLRKDKTAVVIDARESAESARAPFPRARSLPRSRVLEGKDVGEVRKAKDDGRLPMEDHNTRLIVVGADAASARYVAEALAREAFHNVSYFPGGVEDAKKVLQDAVR